ncbi:MAG: MFS transporter [Bacteroidia bacterium]|nr:MFS transporter [Bacteroidia bacterium]
MKNQRSLQLLFTANGISGFAQGISMLAIPWYFTKTQSGTYFNVSYGIITAIVLFFGLYAGTLVDRFSRKANFLGNNVVCGTLIFAIALAGYLNNELNDFWVMAVFGITMLNYNIHYPTLYAFGHEITEPQHYNKVNANIEVVGQSTSILSGAFAALLIEGVSAGNGKLFGFTVHMPFEIARWEIWEIFMLNAITYFIAALLVWQIAYTPIKKVTVELGSVWKRVHTGFNYLKQYPLFLIFGLFSYSVFAMLLVEIHAVLPGYVERHLQEEGSVFAAADLIYAIGALSAGLFVSKVFASTNTVKAIILMTFVTAGIFFWAFASKSVLIIYIVSLILGFTNAGIRVLRLTYLFNHIPNELMGRVNSIFNMANVLTRTVFIFLFSMPFFTFGNHMIWAYFTMALFLVLSGVILGVNYKRLNA